MGEGPNLNLFAGFCAEIFMLLAYAAVFAGAYKLFQMVSLLTEIRDALKRGSIAYSGMAAQGIANGPHTAEVEVLPRMGLASASGLQSGVTPVSAIDTSDADAYAESLLRSMQRHGQTPGNPQS